MALLRRTETGEHPLSPSVPSQSVLGRPEVAIVPALVIAAGALALALSQLLRPGGQAASPYATELIAPGAVVFALGSAVVALIVRHTAILRTAAAIWVYVLGSLALLVGLSFVALLDSGVASVALGSLMLLAFNMGFVFPTPIARLGLGLMLLMLGALHLAVPRADGIEVLSLFALTVTGWLLGRIPRGAHKIASHHALVLSRSDVLTKILNRRGFVEELAYELRIGAREGRPVALAVIDLNGFKLINDEQGHAAGDEMLEWVAARISTLLPPTAIFGRLGGDEFAIALPGVPEPAAEALAKSLHAVLSERIGVSIGVAAQPLGETGLDDLLRVADIALYAAKSDPTRRVQVREAEPSGSSVEPDASPPPYTYAQLRRKGGPRDHTYRGLRVDGVWIVAGFTAIAVSGLVFVASTWIWGGDSFYEQLIRYGGPPWIALNLILGFAYRGLSLDTDRPHWAPTYTSGLLVGVGVATASLSTGDGVTTPILAGLFLKVLFDGATFATRTALKLSSIIVVCWIVVLVLGPTSALWAIPFQLVLFVGAFRLGQVGRHAFDAATRARMVLALSDPLTGLLNRRGFMRRADKIVTEAQVGPLAPVVIVLDLDDFKRVNDTYGHAAGDQLLSDVAAACAAVLGDEFSVGRVGGDEFVAIAPTISVARLETLVHQLDERLAAVVAASVGSAVFGRDGIALDQLLQIADHRAYEIKRERIRAAEAAEAAERADGSYGGPDRRRPRGHGRRSSDASLLRGQRRPEPPTPGRG